MIPLILYTMLFVSGGEPVSIKRHVDKDEVCGHIEGNMLKSPQYPQKYPKNIHCLYTIPVMRNKALKLNFGHFDIESSEGCSYDYLEVRDIENSYGKYCEHNLQGESMVIDDTPVVNVIFHSDKVLSKKGFEMNFEYINKGPNYGGQTLDSFTIKNADALTSTPTTPIRNHSSRKSSSKGNNNKPEAKSKTEQEIPVALSTTNKPFSSETEAPYRSTYKPIATSRTEAKTTPTEILVASDLKRTSEARTEDFTTNEPNFPTSKENELTEASTTNKMHVDKNANTVIPTSRGRNTVSTTKASRTPKLNIRNIQKISSGRRQMKQMISNDNDEETLSVTTGSKVHSTRPTTSLSSSASESVPTKFVMGNETVLPNIVTGNESVPTEVTEKPITTEKMSTLLPTAQPEKQNYKPESEHQVLERLNLMALIQRIKFTTLELEELLIGKLLEEEIRDAKANNELKRKVDGFTNGIGSYLNFRKWSSSKRDVQRDSRKNFIDRVRREVKVLKKKKSSTQ